MRVLLKLTLSASLAICLTACETVSSPVPFGEKPLVITAQEWDGRWFDSNGYVDLSVVEGASGLMQLTVVDKGKSQTLNLQLREASGWVFASASQAEYFETQGLEGIEAEGFLWARVVKDGDVIRAWSPDPEVFASLVNQGQLPGNVEDGSVVLGTLTAEHYEAITSGSHGIVLDWENPTVLYRFESGKPPE